jgi:DNA-binding transcriptional MerR regulator
VRHRIDELAARSGVSVDTIRFYQGKGLLPPPVREGRIAWYSDEHLERLARVRDLKQKGFSLRSIRRLLAGDLDQADAALVAAVAESVPGDEVRAPPEGLTLDELAARSGVSTQLLHAIEREGLLVPTVVDGRRLYSPADAHAVAMGLRLLDAGVPLTELLSLARAHQQAMRRTAERAVDLFDAHVRRPLRAASSGPEAARRLVDAFNAMFPATTALVAHHFGRLLLQAARERIEKEGTAAEIEALTDTPAGSP